MRTSTSQSTLAWHDFAATIDEHAELLGEMILHPVQTNEVGRAAAIVRRVRRVPRHGSRAVEQPSLPRPDPAAPRRAQHRALAEIEGIANGLIEEGYYTGAGAPEMAREVVTQTQPLFARARKARVRRAHEVRDREGLGLWLMAAPFLIGVAVLVVLPALLTFGMSLFRWDLIRSPRFLGIDNFRDGR
jgi:hypothetical protein